MTADAKKHLHDIRQAADNVRSIVGGSTRDAFVTDSVRYAAVLWNLMVIGEAVKRLRREDANAASHISNAAAITSFRDRIVHGYDQIREELV